uniref:Uncharacterized protein n=1 Tax=Arundo donax TaxID=35708 RepID=A0A0A8ZSP1_ARUDO
MDSGLLPQDLKQAQADRSSPLSPCTTPLLDRTPVRISASLPLPPTPKRSDSSLPQISSDGVPAKHFLAVDRYRVRHLHCSEL